MQSHWCDTCYRRKQEHIEVQSQLQLQFGSDRDHVCHVVALFVDQCRKNRQILYIAILHRLDRHVPLPVLAFRELIQGCCRWLAAVAQRILCLSSKSQPTSQLANFILEKNIWTKLQFVFFGRSQAMNYIVIFHLGGMWFPQRMAHLKASLTGGTCTVGDNQQSSFIHRGSCCTFNFS